MSEDLDTKEAVNKVHDHAREEIELADKLTKSGLAEAVGITARATANPNAQARLNQEKKKKAAELMLLKHVQELQREMADLRDEIGEKLDDLADSIDLSKRIREAMKSGNMAELTLLLQEAHRDTEGKTPEELMDMAKDELGVQQTKQETLIQEIKDMAKQYRTKAQKLGEESPELEAEELEKLAELRDRAGSIPGLDFDEVFGDCFGADQDNKFYEVIHFSEDKEQTTRNFSEDSVITNPFNQAAGNTNPFAPSTDKTLTARVKETPASPFASVAEGPSNPFG